MTFESSKCFWCGSAMLMNADICPACGGEHKDNAQVNPTQPRMLIALALAAIVLLAWHWFKASPP